MVELNCIYNKNCVYFMEYLRAQKMVVDAIVTSPPYNINKEYGTYNDNRKRGEYLNWLHEIAELSYEILKDNGSFFLNVGHIHLDPTLPFDVVQKFIEAGYKLQSTIHGIKSIHIEKEDVGKNNGKRDEYSVGHFKPITSKRFLADLPPYVGFLIYRGVSLLSREHAQRRHYLVISSIIEAK